MALQREWFEKDYYKVLGVPQSATETEIRRAYRKLAKENHPDANPGKEERFKEISAAYDVLSEPGKRKEYDEVRRLGPMAGAGAGGAGFPGGAGLPGGARRARPTVRTANPRGLLCGHPAPLRGGGGRG